MAILVEPAAVGERAGQVKGVMVFETSESATVQFKLRGKGSGWVRGGAARAWLGGQPISGRNGAGLLCIDQGCWGP